MTDQLTVGGETFREYAVYRKKLDTAKQKHKDVANPVSRAWSVVQEMGEYFFDKLGLFQDETISLQREFILEKWKEFILLGQETAATLVDQFCVAFPEDVEIDDAHNINMMDHMALKIKDGRAISLVFYPNSGIIQEFLGYVYGETSDDRYAAKWLFLAGVAHEMKHLEQLRMYPEVFAREDADKIYVKQRKEKAARLFVIKWLQEKKDAYPLEKNGIIKIIDYLRENDRLIEEFAKEEKVI